MRIYFDKLLNRQYSLEVELEMIDWFLWTSYNYDISPRKHSVDGVSKQMFGYSANNHSASFPFPLLGDSNKIGNASFSFDVLDAFIQCCLFNIILKKAPDAVQRWREAERIALNKFRVTSFSVSDQYFYNQDFHCGLLGLKNYIGTPLIKDYFHPDYNDRINPRIVNIKFYTNGDGYVFQYYYSFEGENFKNSSWSDYLKQEPKETLTTFIERINQKISSIAVNPLKPL